MAEGKIMEKIKALAIDSLLPKGKVNMEKVNKSWEEEEHKTLLESFVRDCDERLLVIHSPANDKVQCTLGFPSGLAKKSLYILKGSAIHSDARELVLEDFDGNLTVAELHPPAALNNLSLLAEEVYFPLLSNPANRAGWSGPTSKDVMLKFSTFLANLTMTVGQAQGQTLLPYPPPEAFNEDDMPAKDRMHLLETSVVTWANSIATVMSTDPEQHLMDKGGQDPESEVEFWEAKLANLKSLTEQLASEKMLKVVQTLEAMQSPFAEQLKKLATDVDNGVTEISENVRYLKSLRNFFQTLRADMDFTTLSTCFVPMLHTMLLVWQNSKTYNTPKRLRVLVQEICNGLITNAQHYVSGEQIFRLIEDESVSDAVQLLKTTIEVLDNFKNTFRRTKVKAASLLPEGAWDVPEEELFSRLNSFLERCYDIQEFTQIVVEFTKLEKIFISGTKGENLTKTVRGVHQSFQHAVHAFQTVPYDIMDVNAAPFDDDFYQFRVTVKELEKRMSAVLVNGFEDQSTLLFQFKLLNAFEGIVERPIVKDEIDKKTTTMCQSFMDDLNRVQTIFRALKDKPPINLNLPPTAGALVWCRGLMDRITEPLDKLEEVISTFNRKDDFAQIKNVYEALMQKMMDFQNQNVTEWISEIDSTSQSKLEYSLLVRDEATRFLSVNFDKALIALLREVKYLLLLNIEVPPNAKAIYEKGTTYRVQIGNLEMIVNMYNEMLETLNTVERPLVEKDMTDIDAFLEKGIAELNWTKPEVDGFVNEGLTMVKTVYNNTKQMKENFEKIKKMMAEFSKVPLIERKNKPLTPADYDENVRKIWAVRHEVVRKNHVEIQQLLTETNERLKVNPSSPIWRAYVEYVQEHIKDGLAATIANSIQFVCDQLDPANIEKSNLPPLLEIKLGLYANDVLYNAEEINAAAEDKAPRKSRRDVWQIVNDWVDNFYEIGNLVTRMDGSSYVQDLKKNENIAKYSNLLKKHSDQNQKDCEAYRQEFTKFEFLWKTDRTTEFNKFLASCEEANNKKGSEEEAEVEEDQSSKDQQPALLPLEKFEQKIISYQELADQINNKHSPKVIGWLKVNSVPVKQSLVTHITRWISTYTSHLYNDVTRKLNSLERQMKVVNHGLQQTVQQGDSEALKSVLGYIYQIRSQEKSTEKLFQPLRDSVALLRKYGRNLDEYELKLLNDAPLKWAGTVDHVYKVKERVNGLQNEEVENIKIKVLKFEKELASFRKKFRKECPFSYDVGVNSAYDLINTWHKKIVALEDRSVKLQALESVFELAISKHREVTKCKHENKQLKQIWDMISIIKHNFDEWKKTLWDNIDTDNLLLSAKKLQAQINQMPKDIRAWKVFQGMLQEVKNMLTVLPLVSMLRSDAMEERHWAELKQVTHKQFNKDDKFSLNDLIDLELHLHVADVEYIVELATKESKIQGQLEKIEVVWRDLKLDFGEHAKKGERTAIIGTSEEILTSLEENMVQLQSMMGQGKYVEFFLDRVTKWQKSLGVTETVFNDWLEVQQGWIGLETIYMGSKDIRVQLPEDAKRFDEIDSNFRQLMKDVQTEPNTVKACTHPGRGELMKKLTVGLQACEKSLFQYLETKRMAFPRFYFLANAALLDILSNGYDPQCVQKHLGDCFDNISKLKYNENADGTFTKVAVGMKSKDGDEYVLWKESFTAEGAVEDWLNKLVDHMRSQLREILIRAKATADHWEIEKPRKEWLYDYPAQIALTASQIIWTEEVSSQFDAFADGNEQAMKEYYKVANARLETNIQLVLGNMAYNDRVKVMTLITVDVHNRDVVTSLIDEKITEAGQFSWQKQMRFIWRPQTQDCGIRIADAGFDYSYEYVGNTGRLVITPLTDRCYITLSQALNLIMGGAPAGPAGTGKTETVKDLGRALAIPVYVFNCSEQMNVVSMSAIYKGLAQTGAWGCFDEFNRILISVLSVISTQVGQVLNGLRAKKTEFEFMGEMIKLVKSVGMFITMNPGYAGRTELPENLKALFRSCAMVVPDIALICENMLMSEGFLSARRLAKKFTTLYGLSKELLSKQMHYDWGLRATKAVLRVAGGLKRAEPEVDEDRILMRALRDFNLPKLVDEDKPIFKQLVDDLFPGLGGTQRKFDDNLHSVLTAQAKEHGLQPEEMFLMKSIELAELLVIRHSIFVIGPPGCGKSESWKTLVHANNAMGKTTIVETLNPKAIRNNELYGWLTKAEWHDGILSTIMRSMSRETGGYTAEQMNKFIVLDGDIDPEWIESLNTVMDDNKTLTLVSNERIPLTPSMRLIFEISNLDNATPATVSRAGIIFINAKDVGWKPFLDSWIDSRKSDKEKSSLLASFNKYTTPELMNEMVTGFKRVIPQNELNMIKCMCFLLEGMLQRTEDEKARLAKAGTPANQDAATEKVAFEALFGFCCMWSFGGGCLVDKTVDSRKEFSEWWKRVFPQVKYPKDTSIFDFYPDPLTGNIIPWTEIVAPYVAPDDSNLISRAFVPTTETERTKFLLDLLVFHQRPVLLVGTAGTGKTAVANRYMRNLDKTKYVYCGINLNFYTDAKRLQQIMEGAIDKRSGRIYGPPGTKKLLYMLDDMNMPRVDTYGTQSPSALVRQHMDYRTWFDTTKLEKKEIHDTQYLYCMNPTSGSFTIDPRLQGLLCTLSTQLPSSSNLNFIYQTALMTYLGPFTQNIQDLGPTIVEATIALHDAVATKFLPSSKKFHYNFNLRDLSSVFQGICNASSKGKLNPHHFLELWLHETTRVFCDRLVSLEDCEEYEKILDSKTNKFFSAITGVPNPNAPKNEEGQIQAMPRVWSSFHHSSETYMQASTQVQIKEVLEAKLINYNESLPAMDLELFNIAVEHVCRITRIIELPGGNALLVGVGGSGKQSLARLASFICGYDVFQITVTTTYGMNDLKVDLQELYKKTGQKGIPVSFLLTDTQIGDDEWLVYVNDMLSSGYIAGLFTNEDYDEILNAIRNEAKAAGIPDNRENMMDFFQDRVRTNLHIVLCFSPVTDDFRVRCRKFPALIGCTTIDWFHPWPRDALESVSYRFLDDVESLTPEIRTQLSQHMANCHLTTNDASVRYLEQDRRFNYTTPKSFLELISFYKSLLIRKQEDLDRASARLEKGIDIISATKKDVEQLKEDLLVTMEKVAEKGKFVKELIEKMGVERTKVEDQQAIANVEAEKAGAIASKAGIIAADCKRDLDAALPVMEAAKAAVDCLSKASLTTLKSFNNPPGNCLFVTNATMILFGIKGKLDWAGAKKMMKDVGQFMEQLKSYDATTIPEELVTKVQPILAEPWFNADDMASSSEAASNLCGWVVNIVKYNRIYKDVAPKMAAKEAAEEERDAATAKLKAVEDQVAKLQKKLTEVMNSLKDATDEKTAVELEAKKGEDRLGLANRLVSGLAGEYVRWGNTVGGFKEAGRTLVGDVMLSAAFVSYVGAFNQSYRRSLWQDTWLPDLYERKIPTTEGVDPLLVLANDSDFAKWKNEGLANDRTSLENGAIISKCKRWPLMIDPQLQGIKWIRSRTKDLKVIQLGQKRWLNAVIQAVQNGYVMLIEGVGEDLDATLNPVLSRQTITRGGMKVIQIGAEEVQYDEEFQLFIQTKLTNPHYKPETAAQCTLINFIVTEEGLEEQLLALVVNKEKPELEEKRSQLVRAINDYMVSLTDLENELLERLSNAPEDILSDIPLIEGLEKTKLASDEINLKVASSKKQEVSMNAARNEYRLVAAEGSWVYFLIISLSSIDHMYQYSLNAFTGYFMKGMDRATPAEKISERVELLRASTRVIVFTWVNRGLFEKHKLVLSSLLCFKLMLKGALKEKYNDAYFSYLIRGPKTAVEETPLSEWLPNTNWYALQALVKLEGFSKLAADMEASPNRFKEWFNKGRPESNPLPLDWRKLDDDSPFMKLLIVKAMRPDRMTTAMADYVAQALPNGKAFTECDSGKSFMDVLGMSLEDATTVNPFFFILSPGADPIMSVEVYARRAGVYEGKYHRIALGEGQDIIAMAKLEIAHKEGHWVVLENIHLMPVWCKDLEKKLDEFAVEGSNPGFRLFLSAEPAAGLPIGILERSVKLTNEPPTGMKQNLKRAFATFDKDEFEFKDVKVKSILFGLCFFHAIIIERGKFGPQGWNRVYPFNTGDLMNSGTVLTNYVEMANDKIPWNDLKYIFGEILYGGHITDDLDRLLCMTYLNHFMREELLDEMELYPFNESYPDDKFRSPPTLTYDQYFEYIDNSMPAENPVAFGLHPNAEIAVKTEEARELFEYILELQPRSAGASGEGGTSPVDQVRQLLEAILERIKSINFSLDDIASQVVDDRGPFQNSFLQECDRMNMLVREITRALKELDLGLSGELQMSPRMEALQNALFLNRVPAKWEALAYPSMRSLAAWLENLSARAGQLQGWTEEPTTTPLVVQINYLFNPQSFLTAIMQVTAQRQKLELDKLVIMTEVTRKPAEQIESRPRDGSYVAGLYMEGARWNWNTQSLEESLPGEMFCEMPAIICKAMMVDKMEKSGIYSCPVFKTQRRGPTYVFDATLRSKMPAAKWILAGVTCVLEVNGI